MANIALKDVTKRFGDVVAVDDLSLEVGDNEFFVVVGPTGCGKTTLLYLVAGLLKPDTGNIYIDNKLVNDVPPARRGVSMVFQGYALWPHMKVFDRKAYSNLSFALKIRKYLSEEIRERVEAVAGRIGVEKQLFPRKPGQLSEGEKQKVAVGRAITVKRDIFLLDDPLSNLDPPSRLRVGREILDLHRDLRLTTILVTHNLVEAMSMADRMCIMRKGAAQQVGTPDEVYKEPVNEFVGDFIRYYDVQRGLAKV